MGGDFHEVPSFGFTAPPVIRLATKSANSPQFTLPTENHRRLIITSHFAHGNGTVGLALAAAFIVANFDDFVKMPISALRFISSASGGLRRTLSTPRATRLFACANVTLQALTCFCLFGRRPKIQATRAAGGR
jgi:hypothetical protein